MSKKQRKELKKIIIAAVVFIVLFFMEHVVLEYLPFFNRPPELLHGASADPRNVYTRIVITSLYLVPYLICGWSVLRKCYSNIKNRRFMDEAFLMTVATFGAIATLNTGEAAAVMIFYQIGEWFQGYAVGKSRRSIKDLMDIAPETANRVISSDPEQQTESKEIIETIEPSEVAIGDTLVIKPGEKIPVDGVVISGDGFINTAALTGESVPRSVREGERVISGCINGENALRINAEKLYEDSTVAKILEMVENASSRKSHTENFITRFARYYTPIVVYAALALAVIGSLVSRDPATWVIRACTFLVISCPCALVISVPLSFFGGIGAASNEGILVKGSNFLELAAGIKTLISDKTGTLTKGEFKVSELRPVDGVSSEELLEKAALAESLSTHPIALSIREAWLDISNNSGDKAGAVVENAENISGKGLVATLVSHRYLGKSCDVCSDGEINRGEEGDKSKINADDEKHRRSEKVAVGNDKLMEELGAEYLPVSDDAATVVYVAVDGRFIGSISVSDSIKDGASDVFGEAKALGVEKLVMLSGDRKDVAEAVANEVGIDEVHAELLPGDKLNIVEKIINEIRANASGTHSDSHTSCANDDADSPVGAAVTQNVVAYIGDGINDAPVLSRADVGIAMGSLGSDAAIEAADIVIMDDDIKRIPILMRIARKTVGISKQNIVFAIGVKVLFLLLGALGIAGMWWAVFADVGVAVLCILNSMRSQT